MGLQYVCVGGRGDNQILMTAIIYSRHSLCPDVVFDLGCIFPLAHRPFLLGTPFPVWDRRLLDLHMSGARNEGGGRIIL